MSAPGPPAPPAATARALTKCYDALTAVDAIDFEVRRGECFGFLGPNGAGKSTTIKMLQCVAPPTSGTLTVLGRDVAAAAPDIKARLGVVPQEDMLDPDLKVRQNLIVYARYFDLPAAHRDARADQMLAFLQLTEKAQEKVDDLSGGMKRRLSIARALMNDPELLILDEPTTGLDPQARLLIWTKLNALMRQGVTIIITTHYMEEAARLCDRLVIMDGGAIVEQGPPRELILKHVGMYAIEVPLNGDDPEAVLAQLPGPEPTSDVHEDRLYLFYNDTHPPLQIFHDLGYSNCVLRPGSLEDVFLRLTGRDLNE